MTAFVATLLVLEIRSGSDSCDALLDKWAEMVDDPDQEVVKGMHKWMRCYAEAKLMLLFWTSFHRHIDPIKALEDQHDSEKISLELSSLIEIARKRKLNPNYAKS